MHLSRAILRHSTVFFVLTSLLVVWGFWPTYYSNPVGLRPAGTNAILVQLHGLTMSLWCLMLIAQAYLIRSGQRDLHRIIGQSSYVLAPSMVVLQILILPGLLRVEGLSTSDGILPFGLLIAHRNVGQAILFAGLYGFAIAFRQNSVIHSRLMLSTPLVIWAPAIDRIIRNNFSQLFESFPYYSGLDLRLEPFGAFVLTDTLLLVLIVWDWRTRGRLNVFVPVLAGVLTYQITQYFAARLPLWEAVWNWVLVLPGSEAFSPGT